MCRCKFPLCPRCCFKEIIPSYNRREKSVIPCAFMVYSSGPGQLRISCRSFRFLQCRINETILNLHFQNPGELKSGICMMQNVISVHLFIGFFTITKVIRPCLVFFNFGQRFTKVHGSGKGTTSIFTKTCTY